LFVFDEDIGKNTAYYIIEYTIFAQYQHSGNFYNILTLPSLKDYKDTANYIEKTKEQIYNVALEYYNNGIYYIAYMLFKEDIMLDYKDSQSMVESCINNMIETQEIEDYNNDGSIDEEDIETYYNREYLYNVEAKSYLQDTQNENDNSNNSNNNLKDGEYYCMGKNDTCTNKTNDPYDLYCHSCDPDDNNIEGDQSANKSNHNSSDGVVGDNDYDGDVDYDDWEKEWNDYLDDKLSDY
jgi:hypothetical protein